MVTVIVIAVVVLVVASGAVLGRRRGARMHYLDAWEPDQGERRVLDDPRADFYVVPRLGQALKMSFARRRRTTAVVTDRRLVIATRLLLSRRYGITHVVLLGPAEREAAALGELGGGLFSIGYAVLSASAAGITAELDGRKPYVRIVPDPTRSATNVEHLRLYCDDAAAMRDALLSAASVAGA